MAELVNLQIQNNIDYSTHDIIRSYTETGYTEGHLRLGNEGVGSVSTNHLHCLNVRIHFKTDANGASGLSWALKEQVLFYPAYEDTTRRLTWQDGICYHYVNSTKFQLTGAFKYAITTDPNALIRSDFTYTSFSDETVINTHLDNSGCVIKGQIVNIEQYDGQTDYANIGGSCEVLLAPNTDYYLWLYNTTDVSRYFRLFMISGYWDPPVLTVESHGVAKAHIRWDNNYIGFWDTTYDIGETIYFSHIEEDEESREGYTFIGWNTSADGQGIMYYPGDETTATGDTIFYAIWSANYTISYDGDGATSGAVNNTTHTALIASPLATNTFIREYAISLVDGDDISIMKATYTANGWEYGGRHYNSGENVTNLTAIPDDQITMLSSWKGDTITMPSLSKTGYRFLGWNTQQNGAGKWYRNDITVDFTQDTTLYAQWSNMNVGGNLSVFIKVNNQWKASIGG